MKIYIKENQVKNLLDNLINEEQKILEQLANANPNNKVNRTINNYSTPDNSNYITLPFNNNKAYLDFINFVKRNWATPSETLRNLLSTPNLDSAGYIVFNPTKYSAGEVDKYTKVIHNIVNRPSDDTTIGGYFIQEYPQHNRPFTTKVYKSGHVGVVGQQIDKSNQEAQAAKEAQAAQAAKEAQAAQAAKPTIQWRPNDNFPIKLYDLSPKYITPIQQMLKFPPQQQKGYFGPITIKKLKERGVIIDPEIGIRSQDEYNNAVNTLRGNPQSMDNVTSKPIPTFGNKPNTTKIG